MADEVKVNGNVINTAEADHTYRDASSSEFIYVNATEDLSIEHKRELLSLGCEIQEYISDHTYMCHYRNNDLEVLRRLPYVRTTNVYEPSMKTTVSLKDDIRNDTGTTEYRIDIQLHPDAPQDLDQVAQEISNKTGVALDKMTIAGGVIELTVDQGKIGDIEAIDSVNRIEEFRPLVPYNRWVRGVLAENWDYTSVGHQKDYYRYRGRGEIVTVADTGIDDTHKAFYNKINKSYNMWNSIPKMQDTNGHGTHVAGSVVEGVATEAKINVQNMWYLDPNNPNPDYREGMSSGYNPAFMFTQYINDGSLIHTNSWGPKWNGKQAGYTPIAGAMDKVVYENQGVVILSAAGNDGGLNGYAGETGGSNAAKNIITVGNCLTLRPNDGWNYDYRYHSPDPKRMNHTSSTGPTLKAGNKGGRYKPDVVAPGTAILSAQSSQKSAEAKEQDKQGGLSMDETYCFLTGTSMATPHVASCVAVLREALRSPTGANMTRPSASLVRALLINGAVDLKGHIGQNGVNVLVPTPSEWQGYGRVDLSNSLLNIDLSNSTSRANEIAGQKAVGTGFTDAGDARPSYWPRSLADGESWKSGPIPFNQKVFKATLVYPDPPGELLQNNLNLIVRCGNIEQHGNKGMSGYFDGVNNTEKVEWVSPPGTSLSIEVKANGLTKTNARQSFACVWMSHH